MDQHDKLIDTFHETMIMSLKTTEHFLGRAAAEHLLARVQKSFSAPTAAPEQPQEDPSTTTLEAFMAKGGYSLADKNIYAMVRRGTFPVVAFGITPMGRRNAPQITLLLRIYGGHCFEVPVSITDLGRYSAEHKPLYGDQSGFTFILMRTGGATVNVGQLVADLVAAGAEQLAEAIVRLDRVSNGGITDGVPKTPLVPLTDYERDTLPAIPGVMFAYGDGEEELIRIAPAGQEGYVFYTRRQAVEINPRMVEVSDYLKPGNQSVWLLMATPQANHNGISLHAVMSLTEGDPRREPYLPLIDVFVSQSLEHAHRSSKQQ